ncbi:GxxExxY protein [Prosthecobacter sp.]|uniref:GxxExxY protein n=1 Tax=Prosthecobacter sp. TaxID=1965333 RepID=UPI0037839F7F
MPIECPIQFPKVEREAFRKLDYQVMHLAFESHRHLGKNCDEVIYHNDLAARLNGAGLIPSLVEVEVRVRHGSFVKEYWIDLIPAGQAIYELKSAVAITPSHESQTMNYLMLANCEHGKLVNFGSTSVDSRFINNPVPREARYRFETVTTSWQGPDTLLKALVLFIEDIGLFLEAPLYNQALVHHLGGPEHALERRPMTLNGCQLGNQTFQMCSPDQAFRVTTLNQRLQAQRTSFEKLLALSDLQALHWINLNHHKIEFTTLRK